MPAGVSAVAFDIDGTLYPEWRAAVRMAFHTARHPRFFAAFARARRALHAAIEPVPDFYAAQAELTARFLGAGADETRRAIERLVYEAPAPWFTRIAPFPGAREAAAAFKAAGLKVALLSDFPPAQKGDVWGIAPLCDALAGSEECGALKPHRAPFDALARALGVPNERVLYVGNSLAYDVCGAKRAGMQAAWLASPWRRAAAGGADAPDFSFHTYRQLRRFVLD